MSGKEIFNYLCEIGCCIPCSFRYAGCTNKQWYLDFNQGIKSLTGTDKNGTEPDVKKGKANSCICCLGLLQSPEIDILLDKIAINEDIRSYDSESFACAVSLPISQQLRAHSLSLHLEEKFSTYNKEKEVPLKEVWKWIVGPKVNQRIDKSMDNGAMCEFLVTINMIYKDDEKELELLLEVCPEIFKTRSTQHRKYHGETFTRKGVESTLERADPNMFRKFVPCPPHTPSYAMYCKTISCTHNSIHLAGRYLKFSRTLSQTPWVINGTRMMESSVQEIICEPLEKIFKFSMDNIRFSSSGREDCDVRCLGKGRPFALEIINPKITKFTADQFRSFENEINKSEFIKVRDMQLIPKDEVCNVRQGEESKTKVYQALCVSQHPLDEEKIQLINNYGVINLEQKTPIRVLHRRPLAVRLRTVHFMKAKRIGDGRKFILDLETQAGTYVKEFVHGDFGRTTPNLSSILGTEVDIIALDVTCIKLDWPKPVIYE